MTLTRRQMGGIKKKNGSMPDKSRDKVKKDHNYFVI